MSNTPNSNTIAIIRDLLTVAETNLKNANDLLAKISSGQKISQSDLTVPSELTSTNTSSGEKIVEGVFTGQAMKGADDKEYPIPANYISKSKLVEGDHLKLTILYDGTFRYKQIRQVARLTKTGTLTEKDGQYFVVAEGNTYQVITAAVTYYKINPGDKVIINLPAGKEAIWAAVDNVFLSNEATYNTLPKANNTNNDLDNNFGDFELELDKKEGELL